MRGHVADITADTLGAGALMPSRQHFAGVFRRCYRRALSGGARNPHNSENTQLSGHCVAAIVGGESAATSAQRASAAGDVAMGNQRSSIPGSSRVGRRRRAMGAAAVIVALVAGALGYLGARADSPDKPKADAAAKTSKTSDGGSSNTVV